MNKIRPSSIDVAETRFGAIEFDQFYEVRRIEFVRSDSEMTLTVYIRSPERRLEMCLNLRGISSASRLIISAIRSTLTGLEIEYVADRKWEDIGWHVFSFEVSDAIDLYCSNVEIDVSSYY